MSRFTRRQAIIGGTFVTAVGLVSGRLVLGENFEDHVADALGVNDDLARELLERARDDLGLDYDARAFAFLLATTAPSRSLMPSGARYRAIDGFATSLLVGPHAPSLALAYAGLRRTSSFSACTLRAAS